jgi:hypothetical protein
VRGKPKIDIGGIINGFGIGITCRSISGSSTGYALLHNPRLNKETAFTEAERRDNGLEG